MKAPFAPPSPDRRGPPRLGLLLAGLAGLAFSACAHRPPPTCQPLPTGPTTMISRVTVDPRCPSVDSEVDLIEGRKYAFVATAVRDEEGRGYSDSGISCTPDGPSGFTGRLFDWIARDARCPLNPVHWFGPGQTKRLRVLHDRCGRRASFLTLIGHIGSDDGPESAFVIGSGTEIVAHASGRLHLFANDWPGDVQGGGPSPSYTNNTGLLHVSVEALDSRGVVR